MNSTIGKIGREMKTAALALIAVVTLAVPVVAQEARTPLTVEGAVRIALDRSPRIRAAAEGLRITEEAVGEARAPYYPTVSVTAGYTRWETHAFLPSGLTGSTIPSTIGPTNDWTAGLTGRYTLYDSGRRAAELRGALANRGAAEHDAARVREDLALEVRRAFYALVAARDGAGVAANNIARAEEHLRLAQERRAAGAVSGGDVIQAQVQLAEARLALVRIESLARQSSGALNTAMGLPVDTPVETATQQEPRTPADAVNLKRALEQAVSDRPVVQAVAQRMAAATEAVAVARSAFGPRISVDWTAGIRDSEFLPSDRDWRAGVSVTWSLFDGGAKKRRLGAARAARARDDAESEQVALGIRQEVWSAHAALRESDEAVRAAEALLVDADENVRIARERYRVGAGTVNELLDAQAALARAGAVRAQAEWDHRAAGATFQWTIGRATEPKPADTIQGGGL